MRLKTCLGLICAVVIGAASARAVDAKEPGNPIRVGIIGVDTSHAVAFTSLLKDPKAPKELAGMKIVAAYPVCSPDIPASQEKVGEYTEKLRSMGVEIVGSTDELFQRVDAVLVESVDGRPHLAQARAAILAGKPVFVDKPMSASLADAMQIFCLAKEKHVPCFSASSLRFSKGFQAGAVGSRSLVRSAVARLGAPCTPNHTTPISSGTESTAWKRSSRSWDQGAKRSSAPARRARWAYGRTVAWELFWATPATAPW